LQVAQGDAISEPYGRLKIEWEMEVTSVGRVTREKGGGYERLDRHVELVIIYTFTISWYPSSFHGNTSL